jgi:general secretion pathway protein G
LVIAICIIGLLIALAAERLLPLRIEAERAAVEQVLGGLRAGVALQLMSLVAQGRDGEIDQLAHRNPMDFLMQTPANYLGALDRPDPEQIPPGRWYFDREAGLLVYRVRYSNHFASSLSGPPRVRFRLQLVYQDVDRSGSFESGLDRLQGIRIDPLEAYRWRSEPLRWDEETTRQEESAQKARAPAAARAEGERPDSGKRVEAGLGSNWPKVPRKLGRSCSRLCNREDPAQGGSRHNVWRRTT